MTTLEFDPLFQKVLQMRDRPEDLARLGPWLQYQLSSFSFPNVRQLPFCPQSYTRNYVAREDDSGGFEALIIRWDQAAKTPIHGHPGFSFYHVLSGRFKMELFRLAQTGQLRLKGSCELISGDTIWNLGAMGRFDNFIHRITSLEPGNTFHLYSDDALKGLALNELMAQQCFITNN